MCKPKGHTCKLKFTPYLHGETEKTVDSLDTLFANTTHNTLGNNRNESHFQALFQLTMILSRIDHRGESVHREGRTDAVLVFDNRVYVNGDQICGNSGTDWPGFSRGYGSDQIYPLPQTVSEPRTPRTLTGPGLQQQRDCF